MNSRLDKLEKAIRPKTGRNPFKLRFIFSDKHPMSKKELEKSLKSLKENDGPIMVMLRPDERPRDADPDTLIINVIGTPKKAQAIEPEPSDEELPEAIAELEAWLKAQDRGKR